MLGRARSRDPTKILPSTVREICRFMPVEALTFDARAAADCGSFDAYRRLYSSGTDVTRTDGCFHATVRIVREPRMVVFDRRISGLRHSRDAARVRRDGFDHFVLHLLLSGELVSGPIEDERRLSPGEIMIVDTSRPHRSQMERARLISVQLAREHVRSVLGTIDHIHGAILPAAAAGLLSDFLSSFVRRVATLPPDGTGHAARAVTELLGLGLANLPITDRALSHEAADPVRRARAEAFIAAHLMDAGLDVQAVASGIGMSRSALYKVFGVDGGIARYIQQRRLEAVRKALLRPGEDRPLASLAHEHGFANESHFSRVFAGAYGAPPGRFRTEIRQARSTGARDGVAPDPVLARWVAELY
ncbi:MULTISPECIES: helix-turn-helix domain-containing protein [Methylobacterium]|uniref:helix-turn-helix domain-containing protein n=1 Tax=Methylobacterium TaxID=407 RepID=UPI00165052E9|nr:helix-turn-helix domain-containing protein [Methylobacterium sp. WL7]